MEPGEFDGLVAKAAAGSTQGAVNLLQFMRCHKIKQPELVVLHGSKLLRSPNGLGQDVWTVLEQVFFAAVELGMSEWRDYCINKLTKKFPKSLRVERLKGLQLESKQDWAEARTVYNKILAEKPEDTACAKRIMAILKQQGKQQEAIEAMVTYLDIHSTDHEVWHELAELYIEAGALQRAVYCFEELMVSNPRSIYHIITYAELLYSTGDFELSRKYYSLACYIDGSNLRALWGLLAVNMALDARDKANGNDKVLQTQTFTVDKLKAAYSVKGSHVKVTLALLNSPLSLEPKEKD